MPKRNKLKIETIESKNLKKLREKSMLSQRKLAQRLNLSQTMVARLENGREYVSDDYVAKFLVAVGSDLQTWRAKLKGENVDKDLRLMCKDIIDRLDIKKVRAIYDLIYR